MERVQERVTKLLVVPADKTYSIPTEATGARHAYTSPEKTFETLKGNTGAGPGIYDRGGLKKSNLYIQPTTPGMEGRGQFLSVKWHLKIGVKCVILGTRISKRGGMVSFPLE